MAVTVESKSPRGFGEFQFRLRGTEKDCLVNSTIYFVGNFNSILTKRAGSQNLDKLRPRNAANPCAWNYSL